MTLEIPRVCPCTQRPGVGTRQQRLTSTYLLIHHHACRARLCSRWPELDGHLHTFPIINHFLTKFHPDEKDMPAGTYTIQSPSSGEPVHVRFGPGQVIRLVTAPSIDTDRDRPDYYTTDIFVHPRLANIACYGQGRGDWQSQRTARLHLLLVLTGGKMDLPPGLQSAVDEMKLGPVLPVVPPEAAGMRKAFLSANDPANNNQISLAYLETQFGTQLAALTELGFDLSKHTPAFMLHRLGVPYPHLAFTQQLPAGKSGGSASWQVTATTRHVVCCGHSNDPAKAQDAALLYLVVLAVQGHQPSRWDEIKAGVYRVNLEPEMDVNALVDPALNGAFDKKSTSDGSKSAGKPTASSWIGSPSSHHSRRSSPARGGGRSRRYSRSRSRSRSPPRSRSRSPPPLSRRTRRYRSRSRSMSPPPGAAGRTRKSTRYMSRSRSRSRSPSGGAKGRDRRHRDRYRSRSRSLSRGRDRDRASASRRNASPSSPSRSRSRSRSSSRSRSRSPPYDPLRRERGTPTGPAAAAARGSRRSSASRSNGAHAAAGLVDLPILTYDPRPLDEKTQKALAMLSSDAQRAAMAAHPMISMWVKDPIQATRMWIWAHTDVPLSRRETVRMDRPLDNGAGGASVMVAFVKVPPTGELVTEVGTDEPSAVRRVTARVLLELPLVAPANKGTSPAGSAASGIKRER